MNNLIKIKNNDLYLLFKSIFFIRSLELYIIFDFLYLIFIMFECLFLCYNIKIMNHYPLIRTIYLYLFTLLGLALLVIGGVRFADMGLKTFIFTKADKQQRFMEKQPFYAPYPAERFEKSEESITEFSDQEKAEIRQWLVNYKNWEKEKSEIDSVSASRHRDASMNLALILIGFPLYIYHWRIIKKETEK